MKNSNYIKKIFNKERDEITLDDLKEYFDSPQEETSVLEFKSGRVDIINLYKEVAAFLNTEGGLLIIGSPIETKEKIGKNEKVICQGDITYSKFKNKDWLYQKIASNITPTPTGIKIAEFLTKEGTVFLIDVPQSLIPPHQNTAEGKYYIRIDREAKPAPHGLIQALFDKRRTPKLNAVVDIKKINETTDKISVSIKNESKVPADKVSFIIELYNVINVESDRLIQFTYDTEDNKYTCSRSSDKVLVQIVSIPNVFEVEHKGDEYLLFVGYWCKDADFDFKFGTYNPVEEKITQKGSLHDDDLILGDELNRIRNLISPNKTEKTIKGIL